MTFAKVKFCSCVQVRGKSQVNTDSTVKMIVLGFVLCLGLSRAFLFNNERTAAARFDADPECFTHGSAGRCEFYSCFESRLQCGARGYMSSHGGYYCRRFGEYYNSFNEQGKAWINATSVCLTERLLAYYNQRTIECHDLSHFAWNTWSSCYHENGFCDVFWDNRRAFYNVYQIRDFFRLGAGKIWREMFKIAGRCLTRRGYQEFEQQGGVTGILDRIRNLGDRLRSAVSKK